MSWFLVKEAIASTALSHPEDCACDGCKALRGDKEAFLRVADLLELRHPSEDVLRFLGYE